MENIHPYCLDKEFLLEVSDFVLDKSEEVIQKGDGCEGPQRIFLTILGLVRMEGVNEPLLVIRK